MRVSTQINNNGYLGTASNPMLDLSFGAQGGFLPSMAREIDGKKFEEFISNAAHLPNNLVISVLRTPKIFDVLKNRDLGKKLRKIYVDIFTIQPVKITGFDRTLTVETVGHRIGATLEEQDEISRVTRAKTNIVYTLNDKLGESISRFLEFLITYGMGDYRNGVAMITSLETNKEFRKGNLFTPDYYSGTILSTEMDRINVNVQNAYISYNFFPKGTGSLTHQRDLSVGLQIRTLDVPCASITFSDEPVRAYAQKYIDKVAILRKNPDEVFRVGISKDEANVVSTNAPGYNIEGYETVVDGFVNNSDAFETD